MRLLEIFPTAPYTDAEVTDVSVYRAGDEDSYRIKAYFVGMSGEDKSWFDWFPLETIYVAAESLQ